MKNKQVKQMFDDGIREMFRRKGLLAGYGRYELELIRCEYTNRLTVVNGYEHQGWTLEGYVGEGIYKLGTASIKGKL